MRLSMLICRAILLTSAIWFFVVILALFYFINRTPIKSAGISENETRYTGPDTNDLSKIADSNQKSPDLEESHNIDQKLGRNVRAHINKPVLLPTFNETESILIGLMKGILFRNDSGAPGQLGRPVILNLNTEQEQKEKFKINQFNLMVSDAISINRHLPDYRSEKCRSQALQSMSVRLPSTSIIIVFHNEAWSTLLRTLHSIINRSPHSVIEEIILVDDKSERDFLGAPLDLYIERLSIPTKAIHLSRRSGLMKARLAAADVARGQVLLFLDAHVEVTEGWLEPLVARIAVDKQKVVVPIIDVISDDTFEYITASDMVSGGFNWHLIFHWYPVPDRENRRRNYDRSKPMQTPVIAGGLFAIDRMYFYNIGSYDDGMQVWGSENLEISFRNDMYICILPPLEVWTCGGVLEMIPCSRVGHVFRKHSPYTFPDGTIRTINYNAARTAEVWMDGYKNFYYQMNPDARKIDVGDLQARQILRKSLKCKSFRWYLENIYPECPIPLYFHSLGQIKSADNNVCIDTMGRGAGKKTALTPCHNMGGNQAWSFTGKGELRMDELCLSSDDSIIVLESCAITVDDQVNPNHAWQYATQDKHFQYKATEQCLTANGQQMILKPCDLNSSEQVWQIENFQIDLNREI